MGLKVCYAGRMKKCSIGKLEAHGINLQVHELSTIEFFLERGKNIELVVPSNTPHNKNADCIMDGLFWEMKCPMGKSLATVEHLFRKAVRQSENVIFDLRYLRMGDTKAVGLLSRLFVMSKRARRIKIITKSGFLIEKP